VRRLLLALAGTAAGLVALLGFKTHSSTASSPTASNGAASSQSPAAPASGAAGAPSRTARGGTSKPAPATVPATERTVAGAVESTPYGPMQVQVTLQGTRITGVSVPQRTDDGTLSDQIDANAIPQLNRETLAAQSGHIDAVSGASYTSAGYISSLQNALDRAGA
jgi:uncharacterized protein with FMN-binding domain